MYAKPGTVARSELAAAVSGKRHQLSQACLDSRLGFKAATTSTFDGPRRLPNAVRRRMWSWHRPVNGYQVMMSDRDVAGSKPLLMNDPVYIAPSGHHQEQDVIGAY